MTAITQQCCRDAHIPSMAPPSVPEKEIARLRDEVETWKARASAECTAKIALQFQLDAALALIDSIRTAYGIDIKDPGNER